MPVSLIPTGTPAAPAIDDVTRRDLLRGAGALGVGWVLAGCGTDGGAADPVGGGSDGTRSVEHVAGTTEVPSAPERVLAMDSLVAAAVVALGLTPVAGDDQLDAMLDPVADLLPDDLDVDAIPRFGDAYEPDLEAIAVSDPEVIIATELHSELYDELSEIAPTVLVEYGGNGGWRQRFLAIADALGRSERAAEVEAAYEQVLGELPVAVRDVTLAFIRPQDDGQFRFDSSAAAFPGSVAADAGLSVLDAPEGVGEVEEESGYVTVSGERLDLVAGADLIVVPDYRADGADDDSVTQFEANPLWAGLPAVQAGGVLQVDGLVYNGGNHYAAQTLLREIAEAVT